MGSKTIRKSEWFAIVAHRFSARYPAVDSSAFPVPSPATTVMMQSKRQGLARKIPTPLQGCPGSRLLRISSILLLGFSLLSRTGIAQDTATPHVDALSENRPAPPSPSSRSWLPWDGDRLTGDWGGARTDLQERGIEIQGTYTLDLSLVFEGGVRRRSAERGLLSLQFGFDLDELVGLEGGTLFADFQAFDGRDGSQDTGDFQVYSNIDAHDFAVLYECWYQQTFMEERIRLKVGKVDSNSEFAASEHGGEFMHGSFGFSPTLLDFPSYPEPATSVNLWFYPAASLELGYGFYDGDLRKGTPTGRRGPSSFFSGPQNFVHFGEIGFRWESAGSRTGRLGLGLWHHSGTFLGFDGTSRAGSTGVYMVLDQWIFREHPDLEEDDQGWALSFQFGWSDPNVASVDQHYGLGIIGRGLIDGRDRDTLGLGASLVHFSQEQAAGFSEDSELAIEAFLGIQLTSWARIQPDLQYILHPGGDSTLDDVWVGSLRIVIEY
ncbi:MAG: carbohydrate porin [Planctomycetota bacterium]|nr:carbohydrate porin [Planctomycetota bacterium]